MGKLLLSLPGKDCQRGTKSPQQIIQDSCNNTPSNSYIAALWLSFYYSSIFLYYRHIGTNQEKGKFFKKMGKLLLSLPGKDCQRSTKSTQQIIQDSCNYAPSYSYIAALLLSFYYSSLFLYYFYDPFSHPPFIKTFFSIFCDFF